MPSLTLSTAPKAKAAAATASKDDESASKHSSNPMSKNDVLEHGNMASSPSPSTTDNFLAELSALRRSILQSSSSLSPQKRRPHPKKRRSTGSHATCFPSSRATAVAPADEIAALKLQLQKSQNQLTLQKEAHKSKTNSLLAKLSNLEQQLHQYQQKDHHPQQVVLHNTQQQQQQQQQEEKYQKLKTQLLNTQQQKEKLQSQLSSIKKLHGTQLSEKNTTITHLKSQIQTLSSTKEDILRSKDKLEAQFSSTQRHVNECQGVIATVTTQKNAEIKSLKECCSGLERSLKMSTERNELMKGETERLKNRLELVETKHQQSQSTIDSFQTQVDELSKAHQVAISNAQSLTSNRNDLQTEISSLEQNVDEKNELIEKLKQELKESREQIVEVKKEYKGKLVAQMKQIQQTKAATSVDTTLSYTAQIQELQTKLSEAQTEVNKLKETKTTLEGRLDEKMQLLETREKITVVLKNKIAVLTKKLEESSAASSSKDTADGNTTTNTTESNNNKIVKELQTKLSNSQTQLEQMKENLITAEKRLAEKIDLLEKREKITDVLKKKISVLTGQLAAAAASTSAKGTTPTTTTSSDVVVEEAKVTEEKQQLQQTNAVLQDLKTKLEEAKKQHSDSVFSSIQEKEQLISDFDKKFEIHKTEMEAHFQEKTKNEIEAKSKSWKEEMMEKEDELQCAVEEVKRCRAIISEKEDKVALTETTMAKTNDVLNALRKELEDANSDAMTLAKRLEVMTKENDDLKIMLQTMKDKQSKLFTKEEESAHTAGAVLLKLRSELKSATDDLEKVKRERDAANTRAEYAEQAFVDMARAQEQEQAMTMATATATEETTTKRKMNSSEEKEKKLGASKVEHPATKKQKSEKKVIAMTTVSSEDSKKEADVITSLNEDSPVETETEDEDEA